MPDRYRKRPVIVDAMRFVGTAQDLAAVYMWVEQYTEPRGVRIDYYTGEMIIRTLEGDMRCDYGDWIIRGVGGEFYPCKNDIFEKTYELVEAQEKNEIPVVIDQLRSMGEDNLTPYEEMVNAIEEIEMRKKKSHGSE